MSARSSLLVVCLALGACDRVNLGLEGRACGAAGCLDGYACDELRGVCVACSPTQDPREICDGRDNDCDGGVDDAPDGAPGCTSWYADADGDGVGAGTPRCVCDGEPLGLVDVAGDLVDDDPTRYPGAPELCDGLDNDLNGSVPLEERDDDGDGAVECALPPERAAVLGLVGGDCDDLTPAIRPGLAESCDGLDTNCDGVLPPDEDDADGDRFVACAFTPVAGVSVPIDGGGDCDPGTALTYPGALEREDGADNDCDADVDECLVDCDCGPDLHACYRFEAASPGEDGSGNGYDAEPRTPATAPDSGAGVRGTAMMMTVDDLVEVAKLTGWPATTITLEAFISPIALPVTGSRMAVFDGDQRWGLFVLPGGAFRCVAGASADAPSGTIAAGVWTHVACVNDGSFLRVVINGAEVRREVTGPAGEPPLEVWIGANAPDEDQRFVGGLDEMRIWKTPRSDEELCASAGALCVP